LVIFCKVFGQPADWGCLGSRFDLVLAVLVYDSHDGENSGAVGPVGQFCSSEGHLATPTERFRILFLAGMFRDINNVRGKLPLAFAITNLAFLLVGFVSVILGNRLPDLWLPQPRPPVDVGYHRTWPDVLITGVLLGLLFWVQRRIATPSFWKQSVMHSAFAAGGDE
jgi:hypothetical protein